MVRWLTHRRYGPIGVDIGARTIKLVQLTGDLSRLVEASRVELQPLPAGATPQQQAEQIVESLRWALADKAFRGREAVVCLGDRQLYLQNLRVPKQTGALLDRAVAQEAAGRLPFPIDEAEIRYLEAADVRQGEQTLREVVLFAVRRAVVQQLLDVVEGVRLRPVSVDVEPAALARCYAAQYRRDEDRQSRALIVHVGYSRSAALVVQGEELLFVKYIEIGGQHFDLAISRHLKMDLHEAVSLRKHNGDRRAEMQDPEVVRSVTEATRPVVERLASELAMCVRYHSVTFRGHPLVRLVLGGGEATPSLLDALARQIDLRCELSDPFRSFATVPNVGRRGQWDVATGLAMRTLN